MRPRDPLGNHCQRAIALAPVFEPVLAYENGVRAATPLPHQDRTSLQDECGVDRASALLQRCDEDLQSATQREAGAAIGALLQFVGEASDEEIATPTTERPRRR